MNSYILPVDRKDYVMSPGMLDAEYLTATEAAVVSGVPVRDVNRVFDEHILPDSLFLSGGKRCLRPEACALINFYFHTADAFTSETRSHLIDLVIEKGELESTFKTLLLLECKIPRPGTSKIKNWNIEDKFLTVNFDRFFEITTRRYSALIEARKMVVEDPEILGGTPVIRGTRVPVYDVAASVNKGISTERIRAAYPSINDRAIELAKIYADASPVRGRPKETKPRPAPKELRRISRRA